MDRATIVATNLYAQSILSQLQLVLKLFAAFFTFQSPLDNLALNSTTNGTYNGTFDIVIVGAGSAGCLLARRLSDCGNLSVLLIEAGGDPTLEVMLPNLITLNQRSKFDWNISTVNDSDAFQCYQGDVFRAARGHGLGGSSSINYMLYARGDRNDYEQWAQTTNDTSWRYDNILRYFKRSERMEDPFILTSPTASYHGTTGEMGITIHPDFDKFKYFAPLDEIGYKAVMDTNANSTLGFNYPMYNIAEGVRQSSCYCFLSPVQGRKNLYVLKNTKVTKLIIEGNTTVGVEAVIDGNGTVTYKANKEVILSAGAFNTPQILMLSGIGPQDHLESFNITVRKNLSVGYNLMDHIGVFLAHQTDAFNTTDLPNSPYEPQKNYIMGFHALNATQSYPDAQILLSSSRKNRNALYFMAALDNDIFDTIINACKGREILLTLILNLRPVSRGRVMLNSTDPNDVVKVYLNAFKNQTDVNNMELYIRDYLRIENTTYFKTVNASRVDLPGTKCSSFAADSTEYWNCYIRCLMVSIFHYSGTCSMGTVVDTRLRVYGVSNLRIVDASVFPNIPSGNTNAPTIMTAEKAADMIKEDYNLTCIPYFY